MNPIRLRGTADVVASLPYQLGYHLEDCLVVVALRGRAVGMLQRLDLPVPDQAGGAADHLIAPLLREDPDAVLLVAYERDAGTATPLLDAAAARIAGAGIAVLPRVVVRAGRWYGPDCHDGCCPAEGVVLPEPADTPAVADFVGLEVAPLASRGSLASLVAADDAVCREVAAALAEPVPSWPGRSWPGPSTAGRAVGVAGPAPHARVGDVGDEGGDDGGEKGVEKGVDDAGDPHRAAVLRLSRLSLWARACDVSVTARPVDELAADGVAELVRSLEDRSLRDGLIARLCPRTLPFDKLDEDLADALLTTLPEPAWAGQAGGGGRTAVLAARRLLTRLQWLVRAVPDDRCAPVLTVLASVAWWMGEGSLARVALERALEHAPDYRLARLLEQLVDHGIRPGGEAVHPALSA
jgi:hypothetical protein